MENDENDPQILDLRGKTVDEVYTKAWELCKNNGDLKAYLLETISSCKRHKQYSKTLTNKEWKKATRFGDLDANIRRMVGVGCKIQDTKLSHNYDLDCFATRIQEFFQWWVKKKQKSILSDRRWCVSNPARAFYIKRRRGFHYRPGSSAETVNGVKCRIIQ